MIRKKILFYFDILNSKHKPKLRSKLGISQVQVSKNRKEDITLNERKIDFMRNVYEKVNINFIMYNLFKHF